MPDRPAPTLRSYSAGGRQLQYAVVEHSGGPRIVFIHGSPGDWQAFAKFIDHPGLRSYGPRVAPDRPGFGGSEAGGIEPDLRKQAALLAPLLEGEGSPAILVGHSLGGALALRLALDYPERVRGLLLIAPSIAPELEAPRWYNIAASWKFVQWMLPGALVRSNNELYGLQQQVRQIDADLERLQAPVYLIQGMRDRLVDPRTADYLETRLAGHPHRIWRIEDQGHFVLWKQPDQVVDALRDLIAETAAPASP